METGVRLCMKQERTLVHYAPSSLYLLAIPESKTVQCMQC